MEREPQYYGKASLSLIILLVIILLMFKELNLKRENIMEREPKKSSLTMTILLVIILLLFSLVGIGTTYR